MKIDMHIHSVYSDGTDTPEKIIEIANSSGLETISITDHNTYKGSLDAIKNNKTQLRIIPGIEISASDELLPDKARLHILGYNFSFNNENLKKFVDNEYKNSRKTMAVYLELLKKHFDITFDLQDITLLLNSIGDINRVDLAKLLIKYEYCQTIDECFDTYLNYIHSISKNLKPKSISSLNAIKLIKEAGGIVSLAHPSSLKLKYDELKNYILYLKDMGLDAVEIEHIHINPEQKKFLYELCEKENLTYSGGSDYHGKNKDGVYMGYGGNDNKNFPINIDDLSILKLIKK